MQTKQCLLLPYLVLLLITWISLVWPEADGFTALSTSFEMHGAQVRSDTCWGAGDQARARWPEMQEVKAALLQHLTPSRAQWRPWLRKNLQALRLSLPGNGRLLERRNLRVQPRAEELPSQPTSNFWPQVSFKCLSSRADEGIVFPCCLHLWGCPGLGVHPGNLPPWFESLVVPSFSWFCFLFGLASSRCWIQVFQTLNQRFTSIFFPAEALAFT